VIGFLSGASAGGTNSGQMRENLNALRQGLAEFGFFENQNLTIEYRWAEDQYERLPALAADLVHRQVAAMVVYGSTPVRRVLGKIITHQDRGKATVSVKHG
jgi:putative ABC transport system substrate-binding protein